MSHFMATRSSRMKNFIHFSVADVLLIKRSVKFFMRDDLDHDTFAAEAFEIM
jgi:hypothetical protein